MHYVYVICGKKQSLYVGVTKDLKKRFWEHNSNKSFSTKNKGPWRLVYYEAYLSSKDAYRRESALKLHAQALTKLKQRINDSLTKVSECGVDT